MLLVNSISTIRPIRPLSSTIIINPFERLRSMDIPHERKQPEDVSLQIFDLPPFLSKNDELKHETPSNTTTLIRPLKSSVEQMLDELNEANDSSTSTTTTTTTTTTRSIHLPVEKQRGLSEIIRKRNSRCKVEDYKRSIQKSNTFDEQHTPQQQFNGTLSASKSDHELVTSSSNFDTDSKNISKTYSVEIPLEIPIEIQNNNDKRARMSIERLNLLLSTDEQSEKQQDSNEYILMKD